MTQNMWKRLGWTAVLALALASGSAAAQEQVETALPDGFCDDCDESGDFEGEVLAQDPSRAEAVAATRDTRTRRKDRDERRFGRSPASSASFNACFVPEFYVAWLCQGYPRP